MKRRESEKGTAEKATAAGAANLRDAHILDNLQTVLTFAGVPHDSTVRASNLVAFLRKLPK